MKGPQKEWLNSKNVAWHLWDGVPQKNSPEESAVFQKLWNEMKEHGTCDGSAVQVQLTGKALLINRDTLVILEEAVERLVSEERQFTEQKNAGEWFSRSDTKDVSDISNKAEREAFLGLWIEIERYGTCN